MALFAEIERLARGRQGPVHHAGPARARPGETRDTARPRRGWRRRPRPAWATPSPRSRPPSRLGRRCPMTTDGPAPGRAVGPAGESHRRRPPRHIPTPRQSCCDAAATDSFKGLEGTRRCRAGRGHGRHAEENARALRHPQGAVRAALDRSRRRLPPRRQAHPRRRGDVAVAPSATRPTPGSPWPARPETQEPPAAYLADALVALVAGEPRRRHLGPIRRPARVGRPEARARRHGVHPGRRHRAAAGVHVEKGEICHIPGVGPVPVADGAGASSPTPT